jgi:hypothetical protein
MKILLLHSEDDPTTGKGAALRWDRIIDLGVAGATTYNRWAERWYCAVSGLRNLRSGLADLRQVRDLISLGYGRLVDDHGLDWWEIMSILLTEHLEALILMRRLALTIGANDEVFASRPGFHVSLLQRLLRRSITTIGSPSKVGRRSAKHYIREFKKLSAYQIIDIFFDKYDSGFKIRGSVAPKRRPSVKPIILLPTAYINVSRTGLAYANTFPREHFLLVATRRSGHVHELPPNVSFAWLSGYTRGLDSTGEHDQLVGRWRKLVSELTGKAEFETLDSLGYLDDLSRRLPHALRVRDAWRNVLDTEPVEAVLCADDSNPYTRIPMLLARGRGLPNIACHHGALDGRYLFKREYGDTIWVKGKMEEDYLVRRCGVPRERVEIAAPARPASWKSRAGGRNPLPAHILFISEAYESGQGRPEEFYRDILPPLAQLALSSRRKLIVKLHPGESSSQRAEIVASILSAEQRKITEVVAGPLAEDLLASAWFGITILSTVAMECAVRGIPCFLCKWLEAWPHEYVDQFIRFRVGTVLNSPAEIKDIPQLLKQHAVAGNNNNLLDEIWHEAEPGRLRELISRQRSLSALAG